MDKIQALIRKQYKIHLSSYEKLVVGAGSNTYHLFAENGEQYILKNTAVNEMNHPQNEPGLCNHLRSKGIPASEFLPNIYNELVWYDEGDVYHMQRFVPGKCFDMHDAPDWLMGEMARSLGKIHTAFMDYDPLPVGIGENFYRYMTPSNALISYNKSYHYALDRGLQNIADDLRYRIELMSRFSMPEIDLNKLTCRNTHGDYFVSQIICSHDSIAGIIDWTSASIHPVVWEIIRSFIYGSPECKEGQIPIQKMVAYTKAYLSEASLSRCDLMMMPYVFYHQISMCDYYGQYFHSDADNKDFFFQQAELSTKLMKWFELHAEDLSSELLCSC